MLLKGHNVRFRYHKVIYLLTAFQQGPGFSHQPMVFSCMAKQSTLIVLPLASARSSTALASAHCISIQLRFAALYLTYLRLFQQALLQGCQDYNLEIHGEWHNIAKITFKG